MMRNLGLLVTVLVALLGQNAAAQSTYPTATYRGSTSVGNLPKFESATGRMVDSGIASTTTGSGSLVLSTSPNISDIRGSVSATVTAAGSNQSGATALTSDINIVTTVGSGAGVVLPTAAAGRTVVVKNGGANTLSVYPASGAAIDSLSANAAYSLPAGGYVVFNATSSTKWYSGAPGGLAALSTNTFTGPQILPNGSSGTPALSIGDAGGLYRYAADVLGASSAGVKLGAYYSDPATGYMGLGITNPAFWLDINKEYVDTAPGDHSIFFHMYGRSNASALSSLGTTSGLYAHLDGGTSIDAGKTVGAIYGVYGNSTWGVPGTVTSMRGVLGRARVQDNPDNVFFTGDGTITEGTGGYFEAGNNTTGSGTTANAYGVQAHVLNTDGGVIPTARALYAKITNDTAGGGITTGYGLYIDYSTAGAGIGTMYGIYSGLPATSGWYNLFISGAAPSYFAGHIGIGASAGNLLTTNLRVSAQLTGGTSAQGIYSDGIIQSGVTSTASYFISNAQTAAASFTAAAVAHFNANQGTIGSGSAVTTQYGFIANASLTGATNNYGFYGGLPTGSGRYNFYTPDGSAPVYFGSNVEVSGTVKLNANIGIGTTATATSNLIMTAPITGGVTAQGMLSNGVVQSGVTSLASYFLSGAATQASSFTVSQLVHFNANQSTIGAGSVVTSQYGFLVNSTLTGATTNYGFYGALAASGTSRYNLYMGGSAPNYLAGNTGIGTTSLTATNLRIAAGITGGTAAEGVEAAGQVQSDVTSTARYFTTTASTVGSMSMTSVLHYRATQGSFNGSTIGSQYGFFVDSTLTGATANYGFYGNLAASGTSRYNLYMGGTAPNHMAGSTTFGSYIGGVEIAAPAAPAADGWRLFGQDNGAGKTQLCVIFASGAAQCFATQP